MAITDPTDLSDLALWLDASDAATFTFGTGTAVATWADKSGNSRNFTQATDTRQPTRNGTLNSLDVVVFDGTNDRLENASANVIVDGTMSISIVLKLTNTAPGHRRAFSAATTAGADWSAATGFYIGTWDSGTPGMPIVRRGGTEIGSNTFSQSWMIATAVFNGTTMAIRKDRSAVTSTASTGSFNIDVMRIGDEAGGDGSNWHGSIAEVVMWDSADSGDVTDVEDYLYAKWFGGGGDATATPAVIARSVAIPAPTPQAGTVKSAPLIARSATVPAPTPQAGSVKSPAATTLTLTIPAVAASGGGSGTAVPAAIPLAVTIPAPTASGASAGTAAPAVIPLTVTLPAPTATGAGTTSPTVIPLTVTIPAASATGASQGTATPAAITTLVTMPAPTNIYGSTTTPARIQLAVTMPSVAASGSRDVTPAVIPLTVNVRTASATGGTQAIASPSVIATVTVIPAPTKLFAYVVNPQAIQLAVSIAAVLASGIVPDANPITVTLRDAGHTISVRTTGTTSTVREN